MQSTIVPLDSNSSSNSKSKEYLQCWKSWGWPYMSLLYGHPTSLEKCWWDVKSYPINGIYNIEKYYCLLELTLPQLGDKTEENPSWEFRNKQVSEKGMNATWMPYQIKDTNETREKYGRYRETWYVKVMNLLLFISNYLRSLYCWICACDVDINRCWIFSGIPYKPWRTLGDLLL